MLDELKEPVLWVDADSRILRSPHAIMNLECDFAAVKQQLPRPDLPIMATVLYFNQTQKARQLVHRWIELLDDKIDGEHDYLIRAWTELQSTLRYDILPERYCYMRQPGQPIPANTSILFGLSEPQTKHKTGKQ